MYGGAELVAAWIAQALKAEHTLTILAWEQLRLEEINRACGTDISSADYALILPPTPIRLGETAVRKIGLDRYRQHRYGYLMRTARRLRNQHDLVITGFSEADLGGSGIQYVHEPWTHRFLNGRSRGVMRLRCRAWLVVHGFSTERMRANLTLVNSAWSAARVERELGVRPQVLMPPAAGRAPAVPWDRRGQRVVAVGRLVPDKRFEEIVEIVTRVREAGVDLSLDLVGWPDPAHRRYLQRLRERIARLPWATLHESLPRGALLELLASARYGLHAFRDEPFGIAVAEMVRAGCIPFGHWGGGMPEILGTDELLFDTPREAARKLLSVIESESDQDRLRAALAARAQSFSEQEFAHRVRELVKEFGRPAARSG